MELQNQFGINELNVIGAYANYNAALNINVASFNVHDVAAAVQIALQADGLRQQVGESVEAIEKVTRDHAAEVNGMQEKLTDAEIRVKEARNDTRKAEAYSEELSKELNSLRENLASMTELKVKFSLLSSTHFENVEFIRGLLNIGEEVGDEQFREVAKGIVDGLKTSEQNRTKAAIYWYDALQKVHEAVGGDEVIDSDGLGDDDFVNTLRDHVASLRSAAESKRDDTAMITLKTILNILDIDVGYQTENMLEMVRGIKERSDRYNAQECEWKRNYNELCNALGVDSVIHADVIDEAKKDVERHKKQENYQRKYNELKGACGLAGMVHDVAVRMATENPVR
ncbi:hypothetical protein [Escherichia phage KW1E_UTAR]|nr:hypothetical protein [Escherichia phage KW1E_UTAR]